MSFHGASFGDPRTDPDIQSYVQRYFDAQPDDWQTWFAARRDGALGIEEQSACLKAAYLGDTPSETHVDSLGRTVLTLAHNGYTVPTGADMKTGRRWAAIDRVSRGDDGVVSYVGGVDYDGNSWALTTTEAVARIESGIWGFAANAPATPYRALRVVTAPDGSKTLTTSSDGAPANLLDSIIGVPAPVRCSPPRLQPILFATRRQLDIEGNERTIRDAVEQQGDTQGRIVMRYDYDLLGNRTHQASMDAGQRWTLNDAAGKPLRGWDSRGHTFRTEYDCLRRSTHLYVSTDTSAEVLLERLVYGESNRHATERNLRGRPWRVYDGAGLSCIEWYDKAGNPAKTMRQFAAGYRYAVDWAALAKLDDAATLDAAARTLLGPDEPFLAETRHDALNRPVQTTTPYTSPRPSPGGVLPNVIRHDYDVGGGLRTVDVWLQLETPPACLLDPATAHQRILTNLRRNARGQRVMVASGNGTVTEYAYDAHTFRIHRLTTTRPGFPADARAVQNLCYTYDPVGNVTHIQDDADIHNVVFFRNRRVEPSNNYAYDPLYRLVLATGREHIGLSGGANAGPAQVGPDDNNRTRMPHPGDGNAMNTYTESYTYDAVGNLQTMHHHGAWTRSYAYREPSCVDPGETGNRLSATDPAGEPSVSGNYAYDAHGNLTVMPHLPELGWDERDRLRRTVRQAVASGNGTPATTYYTYDRAGVRVSAVTERNSAGDGAMPLSRRLWLGAIELYCEFGADGSTTVARQTLHVMADDQRIGLMEIRTGIDDGTPARLTRYQHGNHLASVSLELDDDAQVLSYEEYYPYGATSYQAVSSRTAASKRYRYTAREHDRETGFTYHDARYYAPWLGRWTAVDPEPRAPGVSPYCYAGDSPVCLSDPNGRQEAVPSSQLSYTFDHWIAQALGGVKNAARNLMLLTGSDNSSKQDAPMPLRVSQAPISLATALKGGPGSFLKASQQMFQLTFAEVKELNALWQKASRNEKNTYETSRKNMFTLLRLSQAPEAKLIRQAFALANVEFDPESGHPLIKQSALGISPKTLAAMASERKLTQRMVSALVENLKSAPAKAASTATHVMAATKQAAKSFIPGSELYDYTKYVAGGGSLAAGVQATKIGIKMALTSAGTTLTKVAAAAAAPLEAGAAATMAVTGAAVVAAAGSVALAGESAHAAMTGGKTPIETADEFYGTHFGDIYGWVTGAYSR